MRFGFFPRKPRKERGQETPAPAPKPKTPYQRARAARDAGDLDEAQRLFGEVVASDPGSINGWQWLTRVALARGDWNEATRAGLAALQLAPSDAKLHILLPEVIAKAGGDAADRERLQAIAWSNAPPKAFLSLAQMHLDAGDRARGRAWLERHFSAGLEPGRELAADLRVLAADETPGGAVLHTVSPPFHRKWLASPAFYARFADAGRCDLIHARPRSQTLDGGWIYPVYLGSTLPLNPASRDAWCGFILDRLPNLVEAMRAGRAVLLLDHGHETFFAHSGFDPRPDFLAFAAHLKAEGIPARRVLLLDGNPKSPALAAEMFLAAGVEGPPVLADRFLWLETAGMFRQIADAAGGAEARLARAEAALQRPAEKLFLSFNHAPRAHRTALLAFLLERGLLGRGLVSFRGPGYLRERARREVDDADWVKDSARQAAGLVELARPRETLAALLALAPLQVDVDYGPDASPKTMAARANDSWPYEATCFSIVTETAFSDGRSSHATEKVIKPIGNLHPFLYMGEPGILAELRSLGFQTFAPMIHERYDEIADPRARMTALLREIERLASMAPAEAEAFRRACWPAVRHNYGHLLALAPLEAERIAGRIRKAVDAALA